MRKEDSTRRRGWRRVGCREELRSKRERGKRSCGIRRGQGQAVGRAERCGE